MDGPMHVVIDVDETITARPDFFRWLAGALRRDGHRVTILTVRRDHDETRRALEGLQIGYDRLETPPADVRSALDWKIGRAQELAPDVVFDDCVDLANAMRSGTLALVPRDPSLGRLDYL